jgi:hypothetical protein
MNIYNDTFAPIINSNEVNNYTNKMHLTMNNNKDLVLYYLERKSKTPMMHDIDRVFL